MYFHEFSAFHLSYLLVSKYFSCKWKTARVNISKTTHLWQQGRLVVQLLESFLRMSPKKLLIPHIFNSQPFTVSAEIMFWKGNNLWPPVSPGIRRKKKKLHRNYRFFPPNIFSCLLAKIILQAETDGFLPCIPGHNNHTKERQQNLTTDP